MSEVSPSYPLLDREKSWLHFGHRVLQEAADESVPLLERLFFCGIFSSNLDEYFRVRVASLRAVVRDENQDEQLRQGARRLLHDIHRIVLSQQEEYGGIIGTIFSRLEDEGIRRVDDKTVGAEHHEFLRDFFAESVAPHVHVTVPEEGETPFLENRQVYLVVEVWGVDSGIAEPGYGFVQIPPDLDRFVVLPEVDDEHEVMYLDDVLRFNLDRLFPGHDVGRAFAVKLTRDAELYVDDEFDGGLVEAIRQSLGNRETGLPSRFLYDMRAPYQLIHTLQHWLQLSEEDMVVGARYHNLNDLMGFPRFGRSDLSFPDWPPLPHPVLDRAPSILEAVRAQDQVVHMPYQTFDSVVRFLEEAAGDPEVEELWLTVYRVASDSAILRALIHAAESGKKVTVFMEVQARFDEESNLLWADRLESAGVRTLYSMRGLKVHAKIAMVVRREGGKRVRYAYVGTGNFNEKTSRIYADHGIFTADERITVDVEQVFLFLAGEVDEPRVEHLLVAPFTLRKGFNRLIEHERDRALEGRESGMALKMNALQDGKIIGRLYEASVAGVPIRLIVRGICCLIPRLRGVSESVDGRSILDRYLEHARIYVFHHDGEERMYLASADWMKRNLSRRVEVAIPVYDDEVKRQLMRSLELQLSDDARARYIDGDGKNEYVRFDGPIGTGRSQEAFRDFVASLRPV